MTIQGVIHGQTIELQSPPGLPDGQAVTVTIELNKAKLPSPAPNEIPPVESWMERLVFDASVHPLERIVKGTNLLAERLVDELRHGRTDQEILRVHPELAEDDVRALRCYAQWPEGLRRSFGGWAEDGVELDAYLEWTRQQRKVGRREIPE